MDPQENELAIDPQQAQNLMGALQAGVEGAGAEPAAEPELTPEQIQADRNSGILGSINQALSPPKIVDAFAAGGLKAVFETKDFLFGDTPTERQSAVRQDIERQDAELKAESPIINGFSSGIGQFSVAMLGIGKLGAAAKALPWVGRGAEAVASIKGGSAALESGKAALAGAIAFDPYEERLSNLIQGTPLANPVNAWLAADPSDSRAMGRVKSAMESLGLDAAIVGTFMGGLKIWKSLRAGDTDAASRAAGQLEAEQRASIEAEELQQSAPLTSEPAGGPEGLSGDGAAGELPAPDDALVAGQNVPRDADASEQAGVLSRQEADTGNPSGGLDESPAQLEDGRAPKPAEGDDLEVSIVANPTAAAEAEGVTLPKKFKPAVEFNPQETKTILDDIPLSLENAEKDWEALTKYGNWERTVMDGGKLSPDMGNFYDRFKTDRDIIDMMDLAVSHKAEQLEAKGFRVRLTDEKLQRQVRAFASLAGIDPASFAGMLRAAGQEANTLTAKMIVSGSYTAKAFTDASLLAMRRKLGDFSQFGSLEAMEAEIAKRFSVATTFLKYTDEMRSQAGRSLRANRGKPFDPTMFEGLSKDHFYDLLAEAQGDPTKLKHLADPALYRKVMDTVSYLRISNLVSGPLTQVVNLAGNGYMTGVRPLERILGGAWRIVRHPVQEAQTGAGTAIIRENVKQYTYMGSALVDGFGLAVKAFAKNDGVLRPHSSEAFAPQRWQVPGTQALGRGYFKPWDSTGNLLYNALSVPLTVIGIGPRTLGGVDELVKQVTYRSKLMARAHLEGSEQAIASGLKGKAARDYVRAFVDDKLDNAFDAEGRGLDPQALNEANTATFQQDLAPGSIGRGVQTLIANEKTQLLRQILPFVKTPTNVLRYGWKMTPGLNLLQEEYRVALGGKMGQEAQAQAVGQMSMGFLFMGAAAYVSSQGMITGGGPSDPKLKAQLMATGWRPYSIVATNDDGTKTYYSYNRFDPVALPFGIIADIQDAMHLFDGDPDQNEDIMNAIGALGVSLAKSFTNRTYLLSLNQALEAVQDPDRNGERFAGSMAQSFVPFSSATRQLSTDPLLRDARTIGDKMMQVIPGQAEGLSPRYNWLGQPQLSRPGLWTSDNGSLVDREVQRLGIEGGSLIQNPSAVWNKVDLRDITLTTGENAYEAYQRLAGQPAPNSRSLRDAVARRMQSAAYERAPDGDLNTKGTKLWMLAEIVGKYRDAAGKRVRADKNVREALMKAQRKAVDHYKHLKQPAQQAAEGPVQGVIDGFGAGK